MFETSVSIETKLTKLREKWKQTIGLDRKIIEVRAKLLKRQLEIVEKKNGRKLI